MGGFRDPKGAPRQALTQAYELNQAAYVGEWAKPTVSLIAYAMSPQLTTLPVIAPPSKGKTAIEIGTQSKKATVVANSRGASAMRKDIK